jgi:hypothetical protein
LIATTTALVRSGKAAAAGQVVLQAGNPLGIATASMARLTAFAISAAAPRKRESAAVVEDARRAGSMCGVTTARAGIYGTREP